MKKNKLISIVLLAVVLVGGIFIGVNWNHWFHEDEPTVDLENNAEDYIGNKDTYTGEKNTDTIDIPGFDVMNLQANTTQQSVNLYNPEQNNCYFKITLMLSDGTILWQSKLIEPGKAVYEITLNQALQAGSYENAKLKYECLTIKEQTPLNGSEIKLTLNVMN